MRPTISRFAMIGLATAIFVSPALGQPSKKDFDLCGSKDVAAIIKGCTAVFEKFKGNPFGQAAGLYNRGLAFTSKGDGAKAIADFDQGLVLLKGHEDQKPNLAYNLYLNRGRQKYFDKKTQEAADDFEAATKIDPTQAEAGSNWALALLDLNQIEQADKQITWSLAIKSDDPRSLAIGGITSFYRGKYDQAFDLTTQAIKLDPDLTWALDNRALMYFWQGNLESSGADLNAVIGKNPKDAWALSLRARIHASKHEIVDARRDVDAALDANPSLARAVFTKGLVDAADGKLDDAQAAFDKSYAMDNMLTEALIESAKLAESRKDLKAAVVLYDRAIAAPIISAQDEARLDQTKKQRDALQTLIEKPAKFESACLAKQGHDTLAACNELLAMTTDKAARLPLLLAKILVEPDYVDVNEVLLIDPKNVDALLIRGSEHQISPHKDLAASLADFSAVLSIDPRNTEALIGLGRTYAIMGDVPKAIADLDAALAIKPDLSGALISKFSILKQQRDYAGALKVAEAMTTAAPKASNGWMSQAEAKVGLGDFVGAEIAADKSSALRGGQNESFSSVAVYAEIALGKGDVATAIMKATQVITMTKYPVPKLRGWDIRGRAFLAANQPDLALADSESALAVWPNDSEAKIIHVMALAQKGNNAAVTPELSALLKVDPQNLDLLYAQALLSSNQGDGATALQQSEATLARAPNDLRLLLLHSAILQAAGKNDAALIDLEKIAALNPNNMQLVGNLVRTHLALGHADAALAALDGKPDAAPTFALRGQALLMKGDKPHALEAFESAVKLDSGNILALKQMGDIYADLGSNDLALQYYSRAIIAHAIGDESKLVDDAKTARAKLMETMAKKKS